MRLLIAAFLAFAALASSASAADIELTAELEEVCRQAEGDDCGVAATRRNDHVYVFPGGAADPASGWSATCLSVRHSNRSQVRGVPSQFRDALKGVPSVALAGWIAADGPLSDPRIQTITFCGFSIDNVFLLDWSATRARVRFDIMAFKGAASPPLGTVASRGIFSGGLSVDRADFETTIDVEDGRFGAFVEIERSRFRGAFRVRNTRIDGALRLRDNDFQSAVRLEALSIGGDAIINGNQFPSHVDEQPREPDGTSFSVVRLRELRLGGVLEIVDNRFVGGQPPAMDRDVPRSRSLYVQKSTIHDNDVTIRGNVFAGRVYLIELEGQKVALSQNVFEDLFEFSSSNIYNLRSFGNQYFGSIVIANNRFHTSLILDDDTFDQNKTKLFDVRSNQVGHDLRFNPKNWPAANVTVDFSFNRIVGPFSFFWPVMNEAERRAIACDSAERPQRWRGDINFLGTTVETSMRLVEACAGRVATQLQPFTTALERPHERDAVCPAESGQVATTLDLTLVEVGVLQLDLAPRCQYAWRGKGLNFRYFGAPYRSDIHVVNGGDALHGVAEDRAILHLVDWLDDLVAPDPEVYFFVSAYLRSRGKLNDSRDWLESAKAETYRPKAEDTAWQQLTDGVVYAALWPAGFGAKPERVIYCMVALWFASIVVYTLHHRGWIGGAGVFLQRLRAPLPTGLTYGLPDLSDGGRPGLGEGPMSLVPGPSIYVEPGRVIRAAAAELRDFRRDWERERERLARPDVRLDDQLTNKLGFVNTSNDRLVRRFSLWSYALDATLPIIPLGRFGVFAPDNGVVRVFSYLHHMLGWWLGALFIGALTIL